MRERRGALGSLAAPDGVFAAIKSLGGASETEQADSQDG
jgi:hypothetical protein